MTCKDCMRPPIMTTPEPMCSDHAEEFFRTLLQFVKLSRKIIALECRRYTLTAVERSRATDHHVA